MPQEIAWKWYPNLNMEFAYISYTPHVDRLKVTLLVILSIKQSLCTVNHQNTSLMASMLGKLRLGSSSEIWMRGAAPGST